MQALLLPPLQTVFWAPVLAHAAASWRDVAQVRDETVTRIQHMAKGVETGARGW